MGALSNIIAFDFHKFKTEVIPAFFEGEESNLIRKEIEIQNDTRMSGDAVLTLKNLKSVMKLFNADLTTCKYEKEFACDGVNVYKTQYKFDRPNENCWTYEDLSCIFENIIIRYCSKYFLSIGKTYSLNLIQSNNIATQNLIDKWGGIKDGYNGGFIWNHGGGGYAEGISGWLDNNEIKELYQNFHSVRLESDRLKSNGDILRSIKEILEICSEENLGVLYGNDLSIDLEPHFQYCLILKLNKLDKNYFSRYPVFETEIIRNCRW